MQGWLNTAIEHWHTDTQENEIEKRLLLWKKADGICTTKNNRTINSNKGHIKKGTFLDA